MAVLVAETSTNLSTALGFTNTLSANLGCFSATELSLSSTRTIAFTPSSAEILNGVILCLTTTATLANSKSVVVTLEEFVLGVWTARATQTISASTICNGASSASGAFFIYFNGGTFPYLVSAAASTWRFSVSSSGAESTHWSLRTSDGTNPFFVAVGSTPTSYTDNTDQIVAANNSVITFDQNFTLKGIAVTGDATRSVCAVSGRRTDPTPANVHSFLWTTAASITGNIDGLFVLGSHSGFRAGTSGSPISVANKGTLNIIRATTGTATISGFSGPFGSATTNRTARNSIFIYGEIPSVEDDTLARDVLEQGNVTITIASPGVVTYTAHGINNGTIIQLATTGALPTGLSTGTNYYVVNQATNTFQLSLTEGGAAINTSGSQSGTHSIVPQIYTTSSTGWVSGDRVFIGGQDVFGNGDRNVYTVSSTSGQNVILTSSLTTNARKSCSARNHIVRFNGYGFVLAGSGTSTGVAIQDMGTMSNMIMSGVQVQYLGFRSNSNGAISSEDSANRSAHSFTNMSVEGLPAGSVSQFWAGPTTEEMMTFDDVNCAFLALFTGTNGGSCSPDVIFTDCNSLTPGPVNSSSLTTSAGFSPILTRCSFENGNVIFCSISGAKGSFIDCHFWGNSASLGSAIRYGTAIDFTNSGNSYQKLTQALNFQTVVTGVETNSKFGDVVANTVDIGGTTALFVDYELASPTGNLTYGAGSSSIQQITGTNIIIPGSNFRVSDFNDTANDDRIKQPFGDWQRTGYNLSDTTVWTGSAFGAASAGQFGWRGAPNASSTSARLLSYSWDFTTGDVSGQTVQVMARVKINNANYYAGTHTKPTLKVNYDNGTEVSSVATGTTADQQLYVSFVPTTSYGKIIITLSGSTDATGTDAYFYIGEIIPSRPPGVAVDTTRLALFSRAAPLPPDSTFTTPASVWDESVTAHQVSGSFGEQALRTEVKVDDATALIFPTY